MKNVKRNSRHKVPDGNSRNILQIHVFKRYLKKISG